MNSGSPPPRVRTAERSSAARPTISPGSRRRLRKSTRFSTILRRTRTLFAALVDRLLASPHYGERMARHWLDATRYADSSGFANDYERGTTWRYRDYVIRSFNNDKPYDQFVREQLAGDEIDPHDPEMLVAVGFPPNGSVGADRHGSREGRASAFPRRRDGRGRADLSRHADAVRTLPRPQVRSHSDEGLLPYAGPRSRQRSRSSAKQIFSQRRTRRTSRRRNICSSETNVFSNILKELRAKEESRRSQVVRGTRTRIHRPQRRPEEEAAGGTARAEEGRFLGRRLRHGTHLAEGAGAHSLAARPLRAGRLLRLQRPNAEA